MKIRFIAPFLIGLNAFAAMAAEHETVEIDAGLWSYDTEMSVEGQGVVHQDAHEACVTEQDASVDVAQMISEMLEGGCQQDSFVHTSGTAKLDMTCRNVEDQTVSKGSVLVTYSPTAYTSETMATITGPGGSIKAKTVTQARRIGACN